MELTTALDFLRPKRNGVLATRKRDGMAQQSIISYYVADDGTLRVYDKADLLKHAPFARTGPHDPGVKECVFTLEFAGRAPEFVTVVGAVPDAVGMSIDLSPALDAALPAAADAIAEALRSHGDEVQARAPHPDDVAPWWQPVTPV